MEFRAPLLYGNSKYKKRNEKKNTCKIIYVPEQK